MDVLKQAQAHFRSARKVLEHIKIPEWKGDGDEVPVIYFYSILNMEEVQPFNRWAISRSSEDAAECVIAVARDAAGEKLFQAMEKTELMQSVDSNILLDLVNQITRVVNLARIEREKALKN